MPDSRIHSSLVTSPHFSAKTATKASNPILSSPFNIPIHKTTADEYFESRDKEKKTPAIFPAETTATVEALLEPEKNEVGAIHSESSTVVEKTTSKLSTILAAHKDLVDLDNIVTVQKREFLSALIHNGYVK
ncbi:unnamed protein product [Rodentolepis nana]|uniref:Uncharacterized protein n=1 Tax=Rodentolepis nana TaxID=102285 RepID=A0A0R3TF52_RODNA|nr:unnamed protein product [Rodentolepis nana]